MLWKQKVILILDKIDFKAKNITNHKNGHSHSKSFVPQGTQSKIK